MSDGAVQWLCLRCAERSGGEILGCGSVLPDSCARCTHRERIYAVRISRTSPREPVLVLDFRDLR